VASRRTSTRLRAAVSDLTEAALERMAETHPWFAELTPAQRDWVAAVAEAGIRGFVDGATDGDSPGGDVFSAAPPELALSIPLQHTVELVRSTVAVVEERVDSLAAPGDEDRLREAVLRYSREVAFAAARVYAAAAESRGAWDARIEAMVIDALLRNEVDESIRSRAAALGWTGTGDVVVLVGRAPDRSPEQVSAAVQRAAAHTGLRAIVGVQGERLVVAVTGGADPVDQVPHLLGHFGPGSVAVSPVADDLFSAGLAVAEAVSALEAVAAWPDAPRLVTADDLLVERSLRNDATARERLVNSVFRPLADSSDLLATVEAYLERAGSIEGAARDLFVHPNTVRYRLRRIADVTGYSPVDARGALTLRIACILGRLEVKL